MPIPLYYLLTRRLLTLLPLLPQLLFLLLPQLLLLLLHLHLLVHLLLLLLFALSTLSAAPSPFLHILTASSIPLLAVCQPCLSVLISSFVCDQRSKTEISLGQMLCLLNAPKDCQDNCTGRQIKRESGANSYLCTRSTTQYLFVVPRFLLLVFLAAFCVIQRIRISI